MIKLKPIHDYEKYSIPVAKEIYATLYRSIFAPLFAILDVKPTRQNATTSPLADALRSGRIQYQNEFFIGPLTAAITKELRGLGAVYNKTRKSYTLGHASLPLNIKQAIQAGNEAARGKLKEVEDFLTAVEGRQIKMPDIQPLFGDIVLNLDKQFDSTTKQIRPGDITVPLEPRFAEEMSAAYTKNLDKYIQDWHDQQVLTLRKKVQENVAGGFRAENLVAMIQSESGVSQRKARFLARQETSLMTSKYRQVRYEEVGVNKYIWSTSHDRRVRHDHALLAGRVFDFSNPPVTDQATGQRNNPGEDFNCRCIAIPILSDREDFERDLYKQEVNQNVPREYAVT